MSSLAVYEKVRSGELSADEGADLLMKARDERKRQEKLDRKPSWMPNVLFVACMVVLAILLAPLKGSSNR